MARLARAMSWAEDKGRDRGLRGPSGAWLGIWVLAWSYRQLRKYLREKPVVVREVLQPGQTLTITHFVEGGAPEEPVTLSRRQARKQRKARRRRERAEGEAS